MVDLAALFRRTVDALSAEPRVVADLAHEGAELLAVPEVYVVALGKAAPAMARGASRVLRGKVRGLVIAAQEAPVPPGMELLLGDHPLPGARSLAAGARLQALVREIPERAGALFLISGGASSLAELPVEGLSLERLAAATASLVLGGAPITAINAVRKHLSQLKGGQLAAGCRAQVRTALVLSDVVGDALDAVGSGPATADPSTYEEALAAFSALDLPIDPAVLAVLGKGLRGERPETPKPGDARLQGVEVRLLQGVGALQAQAEREVAQAGLSAVAHPLLQGDLAAAAQALAQAARALAPGQVLVAAGEVTLRAAGPGEGGRAQHLAATLARELAGEPVQILVGASDGHDFTSGASGALLDGASWARAITRGLDPEVRLARCDSATLCRALSAQLPAFDSDTNLTDLVLIART